MRIGIVQARRQNDDGTSCAVSVYHPQLGDTFVILAAVLPWLLDRL